MPKALQWSSEEYFIQVCKNLNPAIGGIQTSMTHFIGKVDIVATHPSHFCYDTETNIGT